MNKFYMLLITYPGQRRQLIMNTGDKACAASEENKHVLIEMGIRLLKENIISSYTIMTNVSDEVTIDCI